MTDPAPSTPCGRPRSTPESTTPSTPEPTCYVSSEHARAAGHAAAKLCSGAGHRLLYAPPELQQLITEAIEIGYATALQDVRDGDFDGAIREWRPGLSEE